MHSDGDGLLGEAGEAPPPDVSEVGGLAAGVQVEATYASYTVASFEVDKSGYL